MAVGDRQVVEKSIRYCTVIDIDRAPELSRLSVDITCNDLRDSFLALRE